jgi:hypothetical protein
LILFQAVLMTVSSQATAPLLPQAPQAQGVVRPHPEISDVESSQIRLWEEALELADTVKMKQLDGKSQKPGIHPLHGAPSEHPSIRAWLPEEEVDPVCRKTSDNRTFCL